MLNVPTVAGALRVTDPAMVAEPNAAMVSVPLCTPAVTENELHIAPSILALTDRDDPGTVVVVVLTVPGDGGAPPVQPLATNNSRSAPTSWAIGKARGTRQHITSLPPTVGADVGQHWIRWLRFAATATRLRLTGGQRGKLI